MNKLSLFALAALLIALPAAVFAAGWVEQDDGTIQGYRGITYSNGNIIATGNSGNIVFSEDDGEAWQVAENTPSVWMYDIVSLEDGTAAAVGESGIYIESEDGGVTWEDYSFGTTARFHAIDRTETNGYIVGENGTVLYYSDNVSNWFVRSGVVNEDLYAVQDMGDGTAYAVGEFGRLVSLSNNGISSADRGLMASETLHGLYFVSDQEGWIVGENGTIRKTEDGMTSWTDIEVEGLDLQDLYDLEVSGDQMVIVGDKIIITSEDAGETWVAESFTEENITFYAVYNGGTEEIWAAGTDYDVWSSIYHYVPDEEVIDEESSEDADDEEEDSDEVPEVEMGNLVKTTCSEDASTNDPCRAVYYYADDGARHAFTNEKVFYTWFEDFDAVVEISAELMASITLGSNVTYHPGTKMVKFQTVRTVYAVEQGGVLRAIASEEMAEALYGEDWNQQIDDIADVFLGNYSFGEEIASEEDYDVDNVSASVTSLDENF
jgi:photosystem II stability/assembly factor-like uncharacterized protein